MANKKNTTRHGQRTRERVIAQEKMKVLQRERQQKSREAWRQRLLNVEGARTSLVEQYGKNMQRSTSRLASHIAPILHDIICHNGVDNQRMTLQKVLQQPILKSVLPDVVVHSKRYEAAYEVCNSLKAGWQGVKGAHSIDDLRTRNVLTSMVVANASQCLRTMADLIGVKRQSLSVGYARRNCLDDGSITQWASGSKARRKDALSEEIQFVVRVVDITDQS